MRRKSMKKFALCIGFLLMVCAQEFVSAQSLEGTWQRTTELKTECPGLPPVTQSFTDTVTYTEFDSTIELPEEYQNCDLESDGNEWSLDCTYDEEIEFCTYHFHLTGSGGVSGNEFDFHFTVDYTVTGGIGCELVPLCVITCDIEGTRIQRTSTSERQERGISAIPTAHALMQNYPNPFNPYTDIRYQIADTRSSVRATLKIYNILGQEVKTLIDELKEQGYYSVTWDGQDNNGKEVSSGFYFYRLEADAFSATRCMLLLK